MSSSSTLSRHRTPGRPAPGAAVPAGRSDGVPRAGAAPLPHRPGRFRYDRGTGAWWWSPEMFALLGLVPGAVEPCTETLLAHQPAADRGRTLHALSGGCAGSPPFTLRTRLRRADGSERSVVLVGEPQVRPGEAVDGLCIDLTDCEPAEPGRIATLEAEVQQLRAAMASRAAIEQAKGILMLLTGCGDQAAFDLLAHISSHTHRKVRDIAQAITESAGGASRLPDDVRAIIQDACPPSRG